jgi:hypothetical protein
MPFQRKNRIDASLIEDTRTTELNLSQPPTTGNHDNPGNCLWRFSTPTLYAVNRSAKLIYKHNTKNRRIRDDTKSKCCVLARKVQNGSTVPCPCPFPKQRPPPRRHQPHWTLPILEAHFQFHGHIRINAVVKSTETGGLPDRIAICSQRSATTVPHGSQHCTTLNQILTVSQRSDTDQQIAVSSFFPIPSSKALCDH